jgi:hypothetical protein
VSLPLVVFPDAELLVVTYLADRLGPAVRVGTELPEHITQVVKTVDGVVVVALLDTVDALDFVLQDPAVEIGVLAADKTAAQNLAQTVRAHLKAMPGRYAGAVVYTTTSAGFAWEPDEVTNLPQYVLTYELRVRPA